MKKRLFLAIDMPCHARQAVGRLKGRLHGCRWVPQENLHLTLKFMGDKAYHEQEAIVAALNGISIEPFILPVAGLGVFPRRGMPRIIWVGHENAHPRLFQLHKNIQDRLLAIGIDVEERNFHPHVTIARLNGAKPGAVEQFLRDNKEFSTAPFKVSEIVLYSSVLRSEGAVYQVESVIPLNAL